MILNSILDIVHEMFIVNLLNSYRSKIPNFVYMFGYFECQNSLDLGNSMRSLCNLSTNINGIKTPFIILERINGPTFEEYLKNKPKLNEILNYYLQILLSLETVSDIDFSHNDLHTNNVMLRPTDEINIKYKLNNTDIYLKTNTIATIIDFGFSHVKIRGEHFSLHKFERHGVYSNRSNKALDAYKFLMFIVRLLTNNTIMSSNKLNSIVKGLEPLLKYFLNETFINIKKYVNNNTNAPYPFPIILGYTHSNFINYIQRIYKFGFITTNQTAPVLQCSPGVCLKNNIDLLKTPTYSPLELFYITQSEYITKEKLDKYKNNMGNKLEISIIEEQTIIKQMKTILSRKTDINDANILVDLFYKSRLQRDINITISSYIYYLTKIPDDKQYRLIMSMINTEKKNSNNNIRDILNTIRDNSIYYGPNSKYNRSLLKLKIDIANNNLTKSDLFMSKIPDDNILNAIINNI